MWRGMMWKKCKLERDLYVASFPNYERCQAAEQSLEISGAWGIGWAILKDDWTLPWWKEGTFLLTDRSCYSELRAHIELVTGPVPGNRVSVYVGNEQIATICDSTSVVCCIMWEPGLHGPEICFHLQRDNRGKYSQREYAGLHVLLESGLGPFL